MNNYIILILLISVSMSLAQQKPYQIELGANHSWFVYEFDLLNDFEEDFTPMLTIGARYTFADFYGFYVSAGLRYFALERALTLDDPPYNNESTEMNNYLLSVPLQISYSIDVINTSLILNLEHAYILKTKVIDISPFDITHTLVERDVTDQMNKFQFAIGGGSEYKFNLFSQSFGIKSIYNYYLTDVPQDGIFTRDGGNEYEWADFKAQEVYLVASYYF